MRSPEEDNGGGMWSTSRLRKRLRAVVNQFSSSVARSDLADFRETIQRACGLFYALQCCLELKLNFS